MDPTVQQTTATLRDKPDAGSMSGRTKLSWFTLFAYALPAAPSAAMGLPLAVYLPPFYVGYMGLGLGVVGLVFMLARFWDVITDPILGVISDRVRTRWGRRRHWIVASVPIMMFSTWMLFFPVPGAGAAYLIFWLAVVYLGWTLLVISHLSWGAELNPDYHGRSVIQGVREVALITGMVLTLTLPVIVEAMGPPDVERLRVAAMGGFVIIVLPLAVTLAVWKVPEFPSRPAHIPWRQAIAMLVQNRPLRTLLLVDIMGGLSSGQVASQFIFLARDVLMLGKFSSLMLLLYFTSGICFIPLMIAISRRLGKHRALAASSIFNSVTLPLLLFIPEGAAMLTLFCFILFGVNMAAGPFLIRAIMADVADHDAVTSYTHRTGLFYAMLTMTNKLGVAFAIGLGFYALQLIGFTPNGPNEPETLIAMRHVYVWPSVFLGFAVAWTIWRFPIDEKRQQANQRILQSRPL